MSRGGPALLALGLLAACSGSSAPEASVDVSRQAVTSGALDDGDPAVVALLGRRGRCQGEDPALLCTGTLIAPRVVLTAAHCLAIFGSEGPYEVFFGSNVAGPGRYALVTATRRHPRYDAASHENDLALLRLAEPAPVPPQALAPGNSPAQLTPGQPLRVVGFGDTREPGAAPGFKRQGRMLSADATATSLRSTPAPGMSCVGDSGGPVLATVDGTESLYAVTASGDFGCNTYAFNVRVDAALEDFIRPFLAETDQSAAGYGGGVDPSALCTQPCQDNADCPAGLLCVTRDTGPGRCGTLSLGEGSFGETCARDAECGSGTCGRLLPEGPDACRCFTPCAGEPGGEVGRGGCAAAGAGPWGGAGLGLGLALLLLGRRRGAA